MIQSEHSVALVANANNGTLEDPRKRRACEILDHSVEQNASKRQSLHEDDQTLANFDKVPFLCSPMPEEEEGALTTVPILEDQDELLQFAQEQLNVEGVSWSNRDVTAAIADFLQPTTLDKLVGASQESYPRGCDKHSIDIPFEQVEQIFDRITGDSIQIAKSGPVFSYWKQKLCEILNIADAEMSMIFHNNGMARESAMAFLRFLLSLPPKFRQVQLGFHGIAQRNKQPGATTSTTYQTDSVRMDPLNPNASMPNNQRSQGKKNRLGDGLYVASHPSYNFKRGFCETLPDGSVGILLCLVSPGREFDVFLNSCPGMKKSPRGYTSRVAAASVADSTTVICTEYMDAVHVFAEVYFHDVS